MKVLVNPSSAFTSLEDINGNSVTASTQLHLKNFTLHATKEIEVTCY
jgi:hypothetical protein